MTNDSVRRWPYARRLLLRAPAPELVEGHAKELLSRALNIGRVAAFVGSGSSMAYGRISWADMLFVVQDRVLRRYEALEKAGRTEGHPERIHSLLNEIKIERGKDPEAASQLTVFQLSEELDRAIQDEEGRREPSTFRDTVMWATLDERGHVEQMMIDACFDLKGKPVKKRKLGKYFPDKTSTWTSEAIEETVCRVLWGDEFRTRSKRVMPYIKAPGSVSEAIESLRQVGTKSLDPSAIALLCSAQDCYHLAAWLCELEAEEKQEVLSTLGRAIEEAKLKEGQGRPRPSPYRDPLLALQRELMIRRFLTTNYDEEIERIFADRGYRQRGQNSGGQFLPQDPLARSLHTVEFSEGSTGDLVALCSSDRIQDAWVVHLHGRASESGGGDIIATEDDYQRRYARKDNIYPFVEEAISLAFSAHPILFVGIGMNEVDLLRPLREFMSAPTRLGDRSTIAILPGSGGKKKQTRRSVQLLRQYGVYSLYYGAAHFDSKPSHVADWFSQLSALKGCVEAILDAWPTAKKSGGTDSLEKAIKKFEEDRGSTFKDILSGSRLRQPRKLDDILCDQHDDLRQELTTIDSVLEFCLTPSPTTASKAQIRAHAMRLRGAYQVIQTSCLTSFLRNTAREWKKWRDTWWTPPKARLADAVTTKVKVQSTRRRYTLEKLLRHTIDVPKESGERFFSGAPSQTFNTLEKALLNARFRASKTGRRVFLLVAERGVGKGHFFAAFSNSNERLSRFLSAIGGARQQWAGAAFFNLSFSLEVSSVFDRLASFLHKLWPPNPTRERNWHEFTTNRVERLKQALGAGPRNSSSGRILVAINAANILFESNGTAKSGQFQQLFDVLLHKDFADLPLDLVLVCAEAAVPRYFRGKDAPLPLYILKRADITGSGELSIASRVSKLGIKIAEGKSDGNFVHFLHSARGSVLASVFFPSVALMIARNEVRRYNERHSESLPRLVDRKRLTKNVLHAIHEQKVQSELRSTLGASWPVGSEDWVWKNQKTIFPSLQVAAAYGFGQPGATTLDVIEAIKKGRKRIKSSANWLEMLQKFLAENGIAIDAGKLEALSKLVDGRFLEIHKSVGRGRYAMTVLVAAAYQIMFSQFEGAGDLKVLNAHGFDVLEERSASMLQFLDNMCADLRVVSSTRRDDFVISRILAAYREIHSGSKRLTHQFEVEVVNTARLFELQQWLLWHLAMIGQPVECPVLAQCPLVRRGVEAAFGQATGDIVSKEARYLQCVQGAMDLLLQRCLVFRLGAAEEEWPRYSIHRLLQRHIFLPLGVPFVEYTEVDRFSLTLFASQPNDVPRLSPDAHAHLRQTVVALSGYPEDPAAARAYEELEDKTPKNKGQGLKKCMLRAAYGILRSTYSVASIARFDVTHEQQPIVAEGRIPLPGPGIFEEHRLHVRWLIHRAVELGENQAPFYAEQIVWLYNECAVFSLVQGRIPDAIPLFEMALRAVSQIEGRTSGGPLTAKVIINRAIADIDRGRLFEARRNLIVAQGLLTTADKEANLIAEGYIALTHHLAGNIDAATNKYISAIDGLRDLGKSRAASIFERHFADLLRTRGVEYEADAATRLRSAAQLAQEGGHEDLRFHVLAAEARRMLSTTTPASPAQIHSRLDKVERYAQVMGLPRLIAEVDELRARLHRQNGDLRAAGQLAKSSLEVASLHELRLRKTSVLLLYAWVNLSRGNKAAGEAILEEATRLARSMDYFSAYAESQQISHLLRTDDAP